jgi:hypothetical protein
MLHKVKPSSNAWYHHLGAIIESEVRPFFRNVPGAATTYMYQANMPEKYPML